MKIIKKSKNGVTLAEMLLVLMLISIVSLAIMPVLTIKKKASVYSANPTGTILIYAGGGIIPNKYLECNGQSLNKSDYSELYSILGNTYGNTATTFNLPNLNGRTVIGVGAATGLTARNLNDRIGTETASLVLNHLPRHSHIISDPGHSHYHSHSHSVYDPGHSHYNSTWINWPTASGCCGGYGGWGTSWPHLNVGGWVDNRGTGISIYANSSYTNASGSGISITSSGGSGSDYGQAFGIMQPSIALTEFLK